MRSEVREFRSESKGQAWLDKAQRVDPDYSMATYSPVIVNAWVVNEIRHQYSSRAEADRDPRLRDPDGPLAMLLVELGLRDEEDTWAVGDSVSYR